MSRRSTPAAKRDDLIYPIRLKFAVPPTGLGSTVNEAHRWLLDHLGPERWAAHSAPGFGTNCWAVYFWELEDAERFLREFRGLELVSRQNQ